MVTYGRRSACDDHGSASVLGLGLAAALVLVGIAAVCVAQLVVARQHAMNAAELAATAAFTAGCDIADEIARANGATLTACEAVDADVVVTARVALPPLAARLFSGLAPEGVAVTRRAGVSVTGPIARQGE